MYGGSSGVIWVWTETSWTHARGRELGDEVSPKLAHRDTISTQHMAARLSGIIHTRTLQLRTGGDTSDWSELRWMTADKCGVKTHSWEAEALVVGRGALSIICLGTSRCGVERI